MQSFDLGVLATLDALLQEGSVTRAARRLGLSTPAMSHALSRMREAVGDPLLVRSGRGMVLTPRAEALKPKIHLLVTQATEALAKDRPFDARALETTFVVHATDYVLMVLGLAIDRTLRSEAPNVALRFVANAEDDAERLRDGGSDLAVGIYGVLPQEMRSRQLLTDRFVCVVRESHPTVGKRLTLEEYVSLEHIQVAPRGKPGGYVDDALRERGLERRVARAVPYFVTALQLAAQTEYVLTVSERVARELAPSLGLRVLDCPLALRPYALSLVWHPRFDGDAAHGYLRDVFVRAAKGAASERHEQPRTRLDPTDPTSGERRKRPKKRR